MTLGISQKAQAIEDPYPVGTVICGAHFGFLPGIGANVSGDFVIVDSWWKGHFTVGGYAGYNHRTYRDLEYVWSNFAILPRATYGLNITDFFEVHVGTMAGLGYRGFVYTNQENQLQKDHKFIFEVGGIAGCRFRLIDFLYADLELNATRTMSYLNIGVSFVF